jgi:ribosome-associated protein
MARDVVIRGEGIRLGQLLKLAGVAADGGEAKALLAAGAVLVNGEAEERRGRQLRAGDVVLAGDDELLVVVAGGPAAG